MQGDSELRQISPNTGESQSHEFFKKGIGLYRKGRIDEAMAFWRRGLALDPDNYIIRKQIWAVENPKRFYSGQVDYDWQENQRIDVI